jgi:tRNA C32,U32 (ribose-2'-O)-methylase TrmJ
MAEKPTGSDSDEYEIMSPSAVARMATKEKAPGSPQQHQQQQQQHQKQQQLEKQLQEMKQLYDEGQQPQPLKKKEKVSFDCACMETELSGI